MASNPGVLYVVATPIGNLEDITLRALRILREADLVAAEDTRRTAKLLNHYQISTRLTSLHEHNERTKIRKVLDALASGRAVALVSDAGTPTISDPGASLISAAIEAGFPVVPVPGASAVLAALMISGNSRYTGFAFLGFPPTRSKDRKLWFRRLEAMREPIVFFESPHRIRKTLQEIASILVDRPIILTRELTKVHETILRGGVSTVLGQLGSPRGEYTLIVYPSTVESVTRETSSQALTPSEALTKFGLLTDNLGLNRREAISRLAEEHQMTSRAVYALIETAKNMSSDL